MVEEIDFFCGTNSDSYPTNHKIRNLNNRYREILSWIFEVYGGWQFNDSNQTDDTLYADQTLTASTSVYALPTTAIIVVGAEVMLNGTTTWQPLHPITQEEIQETGSITEFNKANSVPLYYQLIGDSIKILPPPSYTQASSLRVWFWKDIVTFAVTDTAVTPGIPAILHRALSIGAALDYALAKGLDSLPRLQFEWNGDEDRTGREGGEKKRVKKFFINRMRELQPIIRMGNNSDEFK